MSSCFPLFSKFKIPKISTSLSAIGTFFCYKRGANMQSSTSEELTTNSSNNSSPRNNGDGVAINSSELSGANTVSGNRDSDSSGSSPMISISRESCVDFTLSRTPSTGTFELLTEFTPPVDPSPLRIAVGMSRSDAREDAKSPLRFTSAPEFSSKFPIDNSENNESLKGNDFIINYLDRIVNNMKIRDSGKEDEASKSLSDPQNLDLHSKIMRGRDIDWKNTLSIPFEGVRPNLTEGETAGLGMRPSFTWVRAVGTEVASEAARRVNDAKKNGGMMTF